MIRREGRLLARGLTALLLAIAGDRALGAPPKLPPPDPARGTIGIAVDSETPVLKSVLPALEVYFVPVREDADRLAGEVYRATNLNLPRTGQSFLLNLPPGRYVAVGAGLPVSKVPAAWDPFRPSFKPGFRLFFPADLILLTEVTVPAGGVVFAGEIHVRSQHGMAGADPAQSHYYPLLSPVSAGRSTGFGRRLSGDEPCRASRKSESRDPKTEIAFWRAARKGIFGSSPAWQTLLDRRIEELTAPAP